MVWRKFLNIKNISDFQGKPKVDNSVPKFLEKLSILFKSENFIKITRFYPNTS